MPQRIILALLGLSLLAGQSFGGDIVISRRGKTVAVSNGSIVVQQGGKTIAVSNGSIVIDRDDDYCEPAPRVCRPACPPAVRYEALPTVVYVPYVAKECYVEPAYRPCKRTCDDLAVRDWDPDGRYFYDRAGRRWDLIEGSPVLSGPLELTGRMFEVDNVYGYRIKFFEATLRCGRKVLFRDP